MDEHTIYGTFFTSVIRDSNPYEIWDGIIL